MKFSKYAKLIRWDDYGPEKIPQLLLICFYIALAKPIYEIRYVTDTLIFTAFAVVSSIYGYLINDLGDVKTDREQGKPNAFEKNTAFSARLIMSGIFSVNALLATIFFDRPLFLVLWILWLLLSTFYSLPPVRFKERGLAGVIIPAIAQQTFPVIIIFSIYDYFQLPETAILLLFPTLKGISLIVRHQINDYKKDLKTGTRTYAVKTGLEKMQYLYSGLLRLESLSIWLVLGLIFWKIRIIADIFMFKNVNVTLLLMAFFAVFFIGSIKSYSRKVIDDPYSSAGALSFVHITFPTFVLPFYLVAVLTLRYSSYAILLFFFLILCYKYTFQLKDRWLVRKAFSLIK